jgi:hypothetical protein
VIKDLRVLVTEDLWVSVMEEIRVLVTEDLKASVMKDLWMSVTKDLRVSVMKGLPVSVLVREKMRVSVTAGLSTGDYGVGQQQNPHPVVYNTDEASMTPRKNCHRRRSRENSSRCTAVY